MRTRSMGLSLLGGLALVVSACQPGTSTAPSSAVTSAPASSAPASASAGSASPSAAGSASALKIGVVTDVGTVDDKNFNQFSYEGAQKGAADIGAPAPQVVVPNDASQYAPNIKSFVDQGFNVIVTVGFNLTNDTIKAAKANPNVWFIGVDQAPLCITETGDPDTKFACKGDPTKLLPKFVAIRYAEDQAGFLAGIVAAGASKSGKIGAIGGINLVPAVVRYIQGYELGAKSVNPSITVSTAYVSTSDFGKAFNDPATGKTFATQFISQKGVDVLFQVAGKTGNGVLQAACGANIVGIGVDVDQYQSLNAASDPTYKCILTSATKGLSASVESTIKAIADGSAKGGNAVYDATNQGIGLAPFTPSSGVSADVQAKVQAALTGLQSGAIKSCPDKCGQP
jgi:basic membrane protein A and related proteins